MITGALVLGLLVAHELVRAGDRNGPAVAVVQRLLVPLVVGFGALLVLRLVDLVVGGA